jgi:hypothetical protein
MLLACSMPTRIGSLIGLRIAAAQSSFELPARYPLALSREVLLLADDDKAHKSMAATRIVPIAKPLRRRLYPEWMRQGRLGMVSLDQPQKPVIPIWEESGLTPIGLQDSRHTAATWLDHAGVPPKVVPAFTGHHLKTLMRPGSRRDIAGETGLHFTRVAQILRKKIRSGHWIGSSGRPLHVREQCRLRIDGGSSLEGWH